jgi:hypothetical protein
MPSVYLDGTVAEDVLCRYLDGCTMAVFDSLRASAPSYEENSSDVRKTLDMLGRVSEKTGCAMLMIHHARKPSQTSQGGAKMSIRGSGAIFDACSSVMVFDASEKNGPIRVSHEKARTSGRLAEDFQLMVSDVPNGSDDRWGVMVSAEACPLGHDAKDASAALAVVRRKIEDLLTERPMPSRSAVVASLGINRNSAFAAIDMMVADGVVVETGTGRAKSIALVRVAAA